MATYNLLFKASDPATGEIFHEGYWEEFYASSQAEAAEAAKDIIVSVYDYEEKIYRVEFTSDTSANVYEISDENYQPQEPKLAVIISDIQAQIEGERQ